MGWIMQAKEANNKDGGGAVAIRQPYLRVVGLEDDIEGDAHNSPTFRYELTNRSCIAQHSCTGAVLHSPSFPHSA